MQRVDEAVQSGAPASSEWYLAYGLLVSLVWIYLESMKIIFRLAMIMGGKRD
ncbi:MAG: Bax inhibitor-1/YccA family membrane protein [Phycisphaerales bacterium]